MAPLSQKENTLKSIKESEWVTDKGQRTLLDLILGIIAFDILALIPTFFIKNKLQYALGIILGLFVAVFMSVHMYRTLEKAILMDSKGAKHKTRLGAFLRLLLMAGALIAAALFPDYISLIGTMIGIFGLKVAALVQPFTDIAVLKITGKGG